MVQVVRIREWVDLLKLEPEFSGWVYRGHASSSWALETALRRTVTNNRLQYGLMEGDLSFAERVSLRTFRGRAHLYLNHLPETNDHVGWLAVMQHHGAPTRLLDFSYSLYVACYFALINAVGDSCVWAIQDDWLRQRGTEYAERLGISRRNELRFGQLSSIYEAANVVLGANNFNSENEDHQEKAVLMIEIEKQIPRLAIQQGIFLMPTDIESPFHENLVGATGKPLGKRSTIVRKIILPHKLRDQALLHLRTMNITAETLFPGIDGFAASLMQFEML